MYEGAVFWIRIFVADPYPGKKDFFHISDNSEQPTKKILFFENLPGN